MSTWNEVKKDDKKFANTFTISIGIIILVIGFVPVLYSFIVSLTDFSLIQKETNFIGLKNYFHLFSDTRFLYSIAFTIIFGIVAVGLELILGFIYAYILAGKDFSSKYSSVVRTLLMIPFIIAPVVVAFTFKNLIYHPYAGYLNYFLELLKLPPFILFEGRFNAIIAIMVLEVIVRTPFIMLILYAGITAIPVSILEAAEIDGVNFIQRIFQVIIPNIKAVIVVACIFRFMSVIKIFDEIYILTQGGPGSTTENISMYATAQSFNYYHTGYSSASTFMFFVLVMVLINTLLKYSKFGAE